MKTYRIRFNISVEYDGLTFYNGKPDKDELTDMIECLGVDIRLGNITPDIEIYEEEDGESNAIII